MQGAPGKGCACLGGPEVALTPAAGTPDVNARMAYALPRPRPCTQRTAPFLSRSWQAPALSWPPPFCLPSASERVPPPFVPVASPPPGPRSRPPDSSAVQRRPPRRAPPLSWPLPTTWHAREERRGEAAPASPCTRPGFDRQMPEAWPRIRVFCAAAMPPRPHARLKTSLPEPSPALCQLTTPSLAGHWVGGRRAHSDPPSCRAAGGLQR